MTRGRLVAGLIAFAALGLVLVGLPDAEAQPEPPSPNELVCLSVEEDVDCRRAAVSVHGDARCGSPLLPDDCVAASGTGDAACPSADYVFPPCPAVSLTGNASGELAVSGTGEAEGAWMDVSACESGRDVDLHRPCHPSEGEVPPEPCTPHPPIRITEAEGPEGFVLEERTPAGPAYRPGSGVVKGSGTAEDPYVIEGWCITPTVKNNVFPFHGIRIEDTDAHVVVRDNVIVDRPVEEDAYRFFVGFNVGLSVQDVSNVTVEENRISIQVSAGRGVAITDASAVEVRDNEVDQFFPSVFEDVTSLTVADNRFRALWLPTSFSLDDAEDVTLEGNTADRRVLLGRDDRGTLREVTVKDNEVGSIVVENASDLVFRDNALDAGFVFDAGKTRSEPEHYRHDIDTSNTVDGEPVRHFYDVDGATLTGPAGQVIVAASTGVTLDGFHVDGAGIGLQVAYSDNVSVNDTTLANNSQGLRGWKVEEMSVTGSSIEGNEAEGILVEELGSLSLDANNIEGNQEGLHAREVEEPVDATGNWWGHATGPSGHAEDACTGAVADGEGDEIDVFEAEVCFDPWLQAPNPDAGAG